MTSRTPADILTEAHYELKQKLTPDEVLDYLLSVRLITKSEFDRCREIQGRANQVGEPLDILKGKWEKGYKEFCTTLGETQNQLKDRLSFKMV